MLRSELDWARVIQDAHQHRIIALLYARLKSAHDGAYPGAVRRYLRLRAQVEALRSHAFADELLRLIALLSEQGISALPFKGPVLANALYGDVALRPFVDLDVLVHREDLLQGCALLRDQGYRPVLESKAGATVEQVLSNVRMKDVAFAHEGKQIRLELHWALFPQELSLSYDNEALWSRAVSVPLNGTAVRTLAPEDLMLYLCVHGAKHGWSSLIWIRDVAEVLRAHPTLDWARIHREAVTLRCVGLLHIGLRLAVRLLGAAVPGNVEVMIAADKKAARLAELVRRRLFIKSNVAGQRLWPRYFWLRARDSWKDGASALLYYWLVPTPTVKARFALPRGLRFMYAFVHPAWTAKNLLRETWRSRQSER